MRRGKPKQSVVPAPVACLASIVRHLAPTSSAELTPPVVAAAPVTVVPLGMRRAATILVLDAWGALLDPVDVDGIRALDLGRRPATLSHLELDHHQCLVLLVPPPPIVHNRCEARRPVGDGLADGSARELLLKDNFLGFPPVLV